MGVFWAVGNALRGMFLCKHHSYPALYARRELRNAWPRIEPTPTPDSGSCFLNFKNLFILGLHKIEMRAYLKSRWSVASIEVPLVNYWGLFASIQLRSNQGTIMPMRIAVSEFSTPCWSFHQDVIKYASRGINNIGISRRKVEDVGSSEAIDLLFEMKMGVSSVSWAGGFTGSDGLSFVDSIDDAIEAIVFSSQIDADCLLIYPGGRNGHTHRHAHRLFENALDTLIPIAADYNMPLAIEPMVGPESSAWSSLNSYRSFFGLLDNFPSEYLGCVVDLFHCGLDKSLLDLFQDNADRIRLIQIADREQVKGRSTQTKLAQRLLPGVGDVDIAFWLDGLVAASVDCGLELEVYGARNQTIGYEQRLAALEVCLARHPLAPTPRATA